MTSLGLDFFEECSFLSLPLIMLFLIRLLYTLGIFFRGITSFSILPLTITKATVFHIFIEKLRKKVASGNLTADMNGEERPFVVTEEYEKVFPFDIYPVQLLKSIMILNPQNKFE